MLLKLKDYLLLLTDLRKVSADRAINQSCFILVRLSINFEEIVKLMENLVKKTFFLNLFIMRILGFYPPRRYKYLYKIYACAVYCFLTIPVPTLAGLHLLTSENVDLTEVGDSSFIIFQVGCFIFKLIPFIFNVDEIRKTIYLLESPLFTNYTTKQAEFIDECIKVCKRNTWLFLGFCAVTFITWSIAPFFGSVHDFPIEIWLPFDARMDKKTYTFTFIFIFLGVGNGAISNGVIDPLVSGLACYATTQVKILKDNLQCLGESTDDEVFKSKLNDDVFIKAKIMHSKIQSCIDHHNAIFEFVQVYENVYSSVVFTQFTASVIVICVSCLQLSLVEPLSYNYFSMISFLGTMLLEVFLYSYFGSTLYDESNSLTSAIYMGKWYEYDIKSKKALIILMERSKRPMIVTAGKILDLSLETFMTILRRAYSLLAVLKNFDNSI